MNKLIILGLLVSAGILNAQTDYRPGYIINLNGDTLFGKIDYRGDLLMNSTCKFKDADNAINEYSPNDIKAFRFIDSKYFVSRELNGKSAFLEYLIKGEINIYYIRDGKGDHYYVDKENQQLIEMPYEESIKYVKDKKVLFATKKHIGILYLYMHDAPEFKSRIQRLKKPEHHSLISLAEDYHNAVCEGEKCVIYEKKQSLLKVNIEAVAGEFKFRNIRGRRDNYYFQSGIIGHIWMPRISEKIYIKTGLLYYQLEDNGGKKYSYIDFPFHIAYMAPSNYQIRPTFSIGLLSPSYSGGFAIKINDRINLGIQSWVNFDFHIVPWIPSQLYSLSILGSLYVEL